MHFPVGDRVITAGQPLKPPSPVKLLGPITTVGVTTSVNVTENVCGFGLHRKLI